MYPTLFKIPWFDWPIRSYGVMLMIGFVGGTWWGARRAARLKGDPDFVVNLGFTALLSSVIGARIFYVLHYWERDFAGRPLWAVINLTSGGLEFYGGLIGAMVATILYIVIKGYSLRFYLDVMAPSVMFGMGMTRIGCFLNGCCWGGVCPPDMAWSVQFPYGSPAIYRQWENRRVTLPAELIYVTSSGKAGLFNRDAFALTPEAIEEAKARNIPELEALRLQGRRFGRTPAEMIELAQHYDSRHVHPAQLYASAGGLFLAILLNSYYYRRRRHGMVFGVFMLTYPVMRVIEEIIRSDNPYDTAGLTISQFVSLVLITIGLVWIYRIRQLPVHSPAIIAPPEDWYAPQADRPRNKGNARGSRRTR